MELMMIQKMFLKPKFSKNLQLASLDHIMISEKILKESINSPFVNMAHRTAISEQSHYYPLQSFPNK